MGTNYYWYPNKTPHCPNCTCYDYERIHIGKQSFGWRFSLHSTGDLNTGRAWLEKIKTGNIVDEYGAAVDADTIRRLMYDNNPYNKKAHEDRRPNSEDEDRCNYDLITGEFS